MGFAGHDTIALVVRLAGPLSILCLSEMESLIATSVSVW